MGELLLCNQEMAAMPYYLESISLNVYSMEEICYYIENNLYLLDTDFMDMELCSWVEQELGEKQLSEQLKNVIYQNGSLDKFVSLILQSCCYCSKETEAHIMAVLSEMQSKSAFECGKIRADRFMENQRYYNAVMEYRRLLQMEEENKKQPELSGNIWHNLGTAYARLFLFQDAAECFLSAYSRNQNKESLLAAMAAFRCGNDIDGLEKMQKAYGISMEELHEITEGWTQISRSTEITEFEQQIDMLFEGNSDSEEEKQQILEILENWKTEYKKNCGM